MSVEASSAATPPRRSWEPGPSLLIRPSYNSLLSIWPRPILAVPELPGTGPFSLLIQEGASDLLATNSLPRGLAGGEVIGPKGHFGKGNSYGLLFTYGNYQGGTINRHNGNFPFPKPGYLGYKFSISGRDHFGWARLRVDIQKPHTVTKLLAFGYETVPGEAVHAGSCASAGTTNHRQSQPDPSTTDCSPRLLERHSLGSFWRRVDGSPIGSTGPRCQKHATKCECPTFVLLKSVRFRGEQLLW
jgi:hypothetical protein